MNALLGIVFCMISQGSKGNYVTALQLYGYDAQHYYVYSGQNLLKEGKRYRKLSKIDKRVCKPVVAYKKLEEI